MNQTRENNHNWRGGKSVASNGYMLVRIGVGHRLADVRGYAYEHRLVAEQKLGRQLTSGEVVHHVNGVKTDNRPENIIVTSCNADHLQHHRKRSDLKPFGVKNPIVQCACGCGQWFNAYDGHNRPRKYVSGHNPPDRSKQGEFIAACGGGVRLTEVIARTGQSLEAAKCMASKLVAEGKLTRLKRGIYGKPN